MSAKSLSFRDLQCVIAICDNGTISKAADACAITQPSLSERVKRIESMLGVELFERNKRSLRTTAAGDALAVKARELLDGVGKIDEALAASHQPLTGTLKVGIISTLGPYLMPYILPQLRRQYPKLELIIHEDLTEALMTTLKSGSLDIVIAAAPLHTLNIKEIPLFHEPFCLAISKSHKMAEQVSISAADLDGKDMVLLQDGHCLSDQALDICPAKRRTNKNRLHSMSLETLRHMVAAGAGYTLLPSLSVGKNPMLAKLIRYQKLAGTRQYGRKIVLAHRKSFGRQSDIALFAQLIRENLPDSVEPIEN